MKEGGGSYVPSQSFIYFNGFFWIYNNLQISIIRKNFSKNIENLKMSSSFVLKERQVK